MLPIMSKSKRLPWSDPTLDTAASCVLTLARAGGDVSRDDLRTLLPPGLSAAQVEEIVDWLKQRGVRMVAPNAVDPMRQHRRGDGQGEEERRKADRYRLESAVAGSRTAKGQLLTREQEVELAQAYLVARQDCFEWATRTGSIVNAICRRASRLEAGSGSIWEIVNEECGDPSSASREEKVAAGQRLFAGVRELRSLRRSIARHWSQLHSRTRPPGPEESTRLGRLMREARNRQVRLVRDLDPAESPLTDAMDEVSAAGRILLKVQRELLGWTERTGLGEAELRAELLSARRARSQGDAAARVAGLSLEEEQDLARALANGDRRVRGLERKVAMDRQEIVRALHKITLGRRQMNRIRDRFVATNQRLVYFWAQRYEAKGVPFADLVQEGNLGLLRAVERYDPTRGFRFSTYAVWWIRQAIARAVAAQSRTIRLPVHVQERLQNMRRVAQRTLVSKGRYPSVNELGDAVGVSKDEVRDLQLAARLPLSLSTPLGDDEDHVLEDRVADSGAASPSSRSEHTQLAKLLGTYLERLTPRQRFVIELRFGLLDGEPRTLEAVGEKLGVTRERIRQITEQVLERMRKWAKRDGLQP